MRSPAPLLRALVNSMFQDRAEAGRLLALKLREFADRADVVVLALPRGGVPVGGEIARKLNAPLDVLVVRKLGVPGQEELAMGAIASGGIEFRDPAIIAELKISPDELAAVSARERAELENRERLYRANVPARDLQDQTVILVDDGIATGACMRVAVHAAKTRHPRTVIVAAPIASIQGVEALRTHAAAVITVLTTARLFAIGDYYRDFAQVGDDEVKTMLARFREGGGAAPGDDSGSA